MSKTVLAIDPGKKKCGIAIVDNSMRYIEGLVIDKEKIIDKVEIYLEKYRINNIVVGSGTNSGEIIEAIKKRFPIIILTKITEQDTTMQARKRYFDYYPPTGLLKIIPKSFLIPPRPYDDFAALVIAERFFRDQQGNCLD